MKISAVKPKPKRLLSLTSEKPVSFRPSSLRLGDKKLLVSALPRQVPVRPFPSLSPLTGAVRPPVSGPMPPRLQDVAIEAGSALASLAVLSAGTLATGGTLPLAIVGAAAASFLAREIGQAIEEFSGPRDAPARSIFTALMTGGKLDVQENVLEGVSSLVSGLSLGSTFGAAGYAARLFRYAPGLHISLASRLAGTVAGQITGSVGSWGQQQLARAMAVAHGADPASLPTEDQGRFAANALGQLAFSSAISLATIPFAGQGAKGLFSDTVLSYIGNFGSEVIQSGIYGYGLDQQVMLRSLINAVPGAVIYARMDAHSAMRRLPSLSFPDQTGPSPAGVHMVNALRARSGGEILVDQLRTQFQKGDSRLIFGVPGESYLDVLHHLKDSGIKFITTRHEGGAAMMAEAFGKQTGRPGVVMVTRAPGATNAMSGLHVAEHDSTPVVMFMGDLERGFLGRGGFQEIDLPTTFGGVAKKIIRIHRAEDIPHVVHEAFETAMSGRPGVVVVSLPEDMLTEVAKVADAPFVPRPDIVPSPARMSQLEQMLSSAKKPVMIVGGDGHWTDEARAQLHAFSERWNIPVAVDFRRQSLFDNTHPNYIGHLGFNADGPLVQAVESSDLVLMINTRLSEVPSQGYTLLSDKIEGRNLVHVYADPKEFGRVYNADLEIRATPSGFMQAADSLHPQQHVQRDRLTSDLHAHYLKWSGDAPDAPGGVNYSRIVTWLRDTLPSDAIITNGAGNFAIAPHRFHRWTDKGTQLAPTSGSMGYGIPAGVAASLMHPDRTVVTFAGDGDAMMTVQEISTAAQYGATPIIIVADNGILGTIAMHGAREYPETGVVGTHLTSGRSSGTNFARLAEAYGGVGFYVDQTDQFPAAFAAAQASGLPAVIHLKIDPEAITPTATLSGIRQAALAKKGQ